MTVTTHLTALEQQRADAELGAAWRRCEAALPRDGYLTGIWVRFEGDWLARAIDTGGSNRREREIEAVGDTPAAALTALAEALEARREE